MELAEYAKGNELQFEAAFEWWAPHTLRRRDRILKAMKKRYHRTSQKFGIELPKTRIRVRRLRLWHPSHAQTYLALPVNLNAFNSL